MFSMPMKRWTGLCLILLCLSCPQRLLANPDGIEFACAPGQLARIQADMAVYLKQLGIGPRLWQLTTDPVAGTLTYTLQTPLDDTNTLDFHQRTGFALPWETVMLTRAGRRQQAVRTTSRKEIVLALMQHGRLTSLRHAACDVQALKDHVGVRQHIVAWSEHLHWIWPDGGYATWNKRYWHRGTPDPRWPLEEALNDVFINQRLYGIGCYTATKLVVMQGVFDYYRRIKKDAATTALIKARLMADRDPLVDIEPPAMWAFEAGFDRREASQPGKLSRLQQGVAARHFVPGDWVYILNTDPVTWQKTGYEGSNAIYLGRNRFDDYYDDHAHSYTYEEKLSEVYQWRNGVFSRTRDAAKIQPLSQQDFDRLSLPPAQGGLVMDYRVVPYLFGHEPLPPMPAPESAKP